MPDIATRINSVLQRIARAAQDCGRDPASIQLLAVSKTHPAQAVEAAWQTGQKRFGENYLQEALEKITQLSHLDVEWHFIGPIQSNKTRGVAEHFAWVHSVDRLKIAERLAAQRPPDLPPLNVCLQVNIDTEASKAGALPDEVPALAAAIAKLPGLRLRGLMCIPRAAASTEETLASFQRLSRLQADINAQQLRQPPLDTLSMGMSADLEAAIAAGATIVRVGSDIFGPRNQHRQDNRI